MTVLTVQERGNDKPAHLRKAGIVPLGLVEKGKPTRKVQAKATDIRIALAHTTGAGMLEVQVEGETKKRKVMVKQIDLEARSGQILTMTLSELTKGEAVVVDVNVHGIGVPEPVENGTGVLMHATTHIRLKGQADVLPSSIEVDVSAMQIGDSISASALTLPAGTELASSSDATMFSVQVLRAAIDATAPAAVEAEEVAAEPAAE